jgi:hypothetical protein
MTGSTHSLATSTSPDASTEQLIGKIVGELGLPSADPTGRAIKWVLHDKDTARTLNPGEQRTR